MTVFEKIISIIFSVIILLISISYMLILGGALSTDFGVDIISKIIEGDILSKIFLAISIILTVLSIKEIAFGKKI